MTKRLALLFFILLLFELLPFCYMSFYVADRRFFAADVSNDLYHPSAYYLSAVTAGKRSSSIRTPPCVATDLAGHEPAHHAPGWHTVCCYEKILRLIGDQRSVLSEEAI